MAAKVMAAVIIVALMATSAARASQIKVVQGWLGTTDCSGPMVTINAQFNADTCEEQACTAGSGGATGSSKTFCQDSVSFPVGWALSIVGPSEDCSVVSSITAQTNVCKNNNGLNSFLYECTANQTTVTVCTGGACSGHCVVQEQHDNGVCTYASGTNTGTLYVCADGGAYYTDGTSAAVPYLHMQSAFAIFIAVAAAVTTLALIV